jgi:hypothetical protein
VSDSDSVNQLELEIEQEEKGEVMLIHGTSGEGKDDVDNMHDSNRPLIFSPSPLSTPAAAIATPVSRNMTDLLRKSRRMQNRPYLIAIVVQFNLIIAVIAFASIFSILEISFRKDLHPFFLKVLTPECTPDDPCQHGNEDIHNPSSPAPPSSKENITPIQTRPFSYMIASDTQLD